MLHYQGSDNVYLLSFLLRLKVLSNYLHGRILPEKLIVIHLCPENPSFYITQKFVFACAGLSWGEHLSPSPSSDACSWRSSTPSPPLSEGGSTSTFWSQVTTDEGIVIDEYDELPRKKKVSASLIFLL